ncbi:MAG: histidinol-phosphate aminotransferase, partial [Pseudomonadota bacterium]
FPNPNAPTGRSLALSEIERLLKTNTSSVVVVDEAYVDFGTKSSVALIKKYPQLLVTHTLSKARSLAGLRVGYAVGNPDLIEALHRVKDSFNSYPLDRFAQAGAIAAMEDKAYFEETCNKVIATRTHLVKELTDLGFEVLPSGANFIFAKHTKKDAEVISAGLRDKNIIVRHFKKPERIAQFLRITVGTDAECAALVSELKQLV